MKLNKPWMVNRIIWTIGNLSTVRAILLHVIVGVVGGIIILHPITMGISWFEFYPEQATFARVWEIVSYRVVHAFSAEMLPMTLVFTVIGGALGLVFGILYSTIVRRGIALHSMQRELTKDVASLIRSGESETVEVKASARWDQKLLKVNREIEMRIIRTIAGFMNHKGGSLVIGADDAGTVVGLEQDYATLKRSDRDGFELFIMTLVKNQLGGAVCSLVHVLFQELESKDVCRIVVETSDRPVYVKGAVGAQYFLRAGNSTRELDAREAHHHIMQRWGVVRSV